MERTNELVEQCHEGSCKRDPSSEPKIVYVDRPYVVEKQVKTPVFPWADFGLVVGIFVGFLIILWGIYSAATTPTSYAVESACGDLGEDFAHATKISSYDVESRVRDGVCSLTVLKGPYQGIISEEYAQAKYKLTALEQERFPGGLKLVEDEPKEGPAKDPREESCERELEKARVSTDKYYQWWMEEMEKGRTPQSKYGNTEIRHVGGRTVRVHFKVALPHPRWRKDDGSNWVKVLWIVEVLGMNDWIRLFVTEPVQVEGEVPGPDRFDELFEEAEKMLVGPPPTKGTT